MSSTKSVDIAPPTASKRRLPGTLIGLSVVLGALIIGAVQGGVAMLVDPYTPLGMSTEYLEGTPVHSYVLPGWFLLGIAVASALTLAGIVFDWRWAWASRLERSLGYRWPWLGSVLTGGVLLVFEIIELFMVPFHPVMHPLLIAVSLVLVVIPFTSRTRSALAVTR